jgi:hypothetical protein
VRDAQAWTDTGGSLCRRTYRRTSGGGYRKVRLGCYDFDEFTSGQQIPGSVSTYAYSSTVPNNGVKPNGSTGNFGSVLNGGTYTVALPAFAPVLSFLAGSIDAYNSVTLGIFDTAQNATSFLTWTGSQLGTIGGDGRITFDTGSASMLISSVSFRSGQNSFEIDNIASAAPEPATWAMMILGFGFAGMGLRSARRGREKLALA